VALQNIRRATNNSCWEQANAYLSRASNHRRDLEPVIHRLAQILFATQIPLCSLHRDTVEQELNLFQFAAAGMLQPGENRSLKR
jgi:hypothetical protein